MIEVYDGLVPLSGINRAFNITKVLNYRPDRASTLHSKRHSLFSELSDYDLKQTGLRDIIVDKFFNRIKNYRIHRSYVNMCAPGEYFEVHTDSFNTGQLTLLYFMNSEWVSKYGGEIVFYDNAGIEPIEMCNFIPGRIVLFSSEIPHRSNTVNHTTEERRYSLAIKLVNESDRLYYQTSFKRQITCNQTPTVKEQKAIEFLASITQDLPHSQSTFFDHCLNTFYILKSYELPEEVTLAGLFHSIYGTDSFKTPFDIGRDEIKKYIGNKAEEIAFVFCSLENRTNRIIEDDIPEEIKNELKWIEYANINEQCERVRDPQREERMIDTLLTLQSQLIKR